MSELHLGVMDRSYAEGRRKRAYLRWRYCVRARYAADRFRDRRPDRTGPLRVLEMGAADGRTLLEMRALLGGDGVFEGLELQPDLIDEAPPLPSNVRLVCGDVMAPPETFERGSYDLIAALALLEHLPDPLACVRAAYDLLAPGGVFVASCPHPVWDEIAGALRMVADEHHEDHMTGDKMRRLAEEAGFERCETEPFMWAPVGVLPYANLWVSPARALEIDARVRRLGPLGKPGFVNQGLVAQKPR
ncbi:MAG: class I SAM-dependent methyltransferase [Sandaracinaceae bacterium]